MSLLKRLISEVHRRSLWQVLGIYLAASWLALQVVGQLTEAAGLPNWLPSLALALLVVGLPIVLATAFVQEGPPSRAAPEAETARAAGVEGGEEERVGVGVAAAEPGVAHRLFTWRNAIGGGVLALASWGVVAAAWLLLGSRAPRGESRAAATDLPVIAVLPFANLRISLISRCRGTVATLLASRFT